MSDYDTDLLLWSERQAALLRRAAAGERVNDQVDWENVAEEIESLGKSDRRELTNRIRTILTHLIKLDVASHGTAAGLARDDHRAARGNPDAAGRQPKPEIHCAGDHGQGTFHCPRRGNGLSGRLQ